MIPNNINATIVTKLKQQSENINIAKYIEAFKRQGAMVKMIYFEAFFQW